VLISITRVRPSNISSASASAPARRRNNGAAHRHACGVRAHMKRRHVGAVAAGDPLDRFKRERRIAGVNRQAGIEGTVTSMSFMSKRVGSLFGDSNSKKTPDLFFE
jgi:hypothetical protein